MAPGCYDRKRTLCCESPLSSARRIREEPQGGTLLFISLERDNSFGGSGAAPGLSKSVKKMSQTNPRPFLIAAIGASAGGLEAYETFFKNMPPDAGIAFAVVMHLAPDHESALTQLLARHTRMSVEQALDNTKVIPNRVYIIPPNATLTIKDCVLQVTASAEPRGRRMPIDSLFVSLAEDRGELAVCIMLSGNGADGALGLRAIKEHGGMAMAQTLETAKYDAILRNAITTGLVDHLLPVEAMPAKLMEYAAHLTALNQPNSIREPLRMYIEKVHGLLRRRTRHDFSQYKESTFARRLERRIKALQIQSIEHYIDVLERQPDEVDRLFNDLLIGVTQFFRDPEAFNALATEVMPKLFEGKGADGQVRVGVVGCASGEEAYSIAILLREHASILDNPPKLQIFATDIDERGLEIARKGLYPESIAEHVSSGRLERFFSREGNGFQIKRKVREICIFSAHSFIKDPPFSRLDLISCRNVMIYLGMDLQRGISPLFHYALRFGGYLFLGSSENVTLHQELFRTMDKKHRIFQRKEVLLRPPVRFPLANLGSPAAPGRTHSDGGMPTLPKQLERIILQRYGPACVLVRENGEAVYFSGRITRYLEQPAGSPDSNVLHIAREGLRVPLRTCLRGAVTARVRSVQQRVSLDLDGKISHVDVTVEPLEDFESNLYVIVLADSAPIGGSTPNDEQTLDTRSEDTIRYLEGELRTAQENAQAAYEELETSNEELKSANEEYQSTNEELETSKEELQSFNEELETVNAELLRKVAEVDHANSDLQNLLNSTQIATIFLDSELRIRSFTPAAGAVFRILPGDVGRPLTDLAAQFAGVDGLIEDMTEVYRTLSPRERELTGAQGQFFLTRMMPYRTTHDVIDGVVVTFFDVAQLKGAEQRALDAKIYAEDIVRTVREPLLVLDAGLRVQSANRSFCEMFRVSENEMKGQVVFDFGNRQWDIPELRRLLGEVLPQRKEVRDFRAEHDFPGLGRRIMLLGAREIPHEKDRAPLILLSIDDITESKDLLRKINEELQHIAYATSHDLQEPVRMVVSYTQLLAREYKGRLDSQADRFIAYAVEGALRIETLLRDLREYWAVHEQWIEHPIPVDSNRACKETVRVLNAPIQESGARVTLDRLPTIMAEEVPLRLLFQNLIGNAIKYRRPGEQSQIHIGARREGGLWIFSVTDNGIGIEARHLKTIFAPFKRLHALDDYPGSGIGLAICKKIVERAGGRIWVDSTPGLGSTFNFTMPAKDGDE
jgi:two-component system CheB/CheR fusion protein